MKSLEIHDLVVVGAGPAGLSAALTAESERLDTLVLDSGHELGGQASQSSCIENYPGFPDGISGTTLTSRLVDHALKFSTEFRGPTRVESLSTVDEGILARTDAGDEYIGKAALLSTGVEFIQLNALNLAAYTGRGVHYGPAPASADYSGKTVAVIGGANSAGQAAFNLASFDACNVHLLIRGNSIEDKMSGYLIDKIHDRANIEIHTDTQLIGVDGNGRVSSATVQKENDSPHDMEVDEVFVFIGSIPKTLWLPPEIAKDSKNFVISGSDLSQTARDEFMDKTGRTPYAHETTMPGVFVAGDVRCGTNKRVALAVGDGAGVIPEIHNLRSLESK